MNPDDDPEARIRALEQPLSEQARASELGGSQSPSDAAYLPPPVSGYSPPDYNTQQYGEQQYGAQPFGTQPYDAQQQYGQQPYGTQQWGGQQWGSGPQKVSAGIPWMVFGMIAVVFIAIAGGAIVFMTTMSKVSTPDGDSGISDGGSVVISIPPDEPSVDVPEVPEVPSFPAAPGEAPTDPNAIVGAPGQMVTVSGIDENKTVACNEAAVTVSGIRNTVNITGHCVNVLVTGIENTVTIDAADTISASGSQNKVTYRTGAPQINASGDNVVQLG